MFRAWVLLIATAASASECLDAVVVAAQHAPAGAPTDQDSVGSKRRRRRRRVEPPPPAPERAPAPREPPAGPSGAPGGAGTRRLPFRDPERVTEINRTLDLIAQGGPFPYRQDGVVFGNREQRLPAHPHGYYHEYTVRTPGLTHRGARRIVQGAQPERETYYSDDHYRSFVVIDPRRY